MVKLTINNQIIEIDAGKTVLEACTKAGIEIPVFCYHPRLPVAGNCRMCLVEIEKSPKPIASCSMPVCEGMVVHTNSPMVEKARKGTLEFLLINHPLDCPICDQGGECDLQDITMGYAKSNSRFELNKRAVSDKYMGPLIKTVMTRCIHCTRCIRFANDIAGIPEIGAIGRGEDMEITTLENAVKSELSGNMIDICPVGALTSKPYAFHGRSWELKKTDSIDVLDAVGSNIYIDSRGREVMRILPRLNEGINEEWISDRTRFAYDGLKYQRLDQPYLRKNGKLKPCTWEDAFKVIVDKFKSIKSKQAAAIAGDLVDCESAFSLKVLYDLMGSPHYDCRQDLTQLPTSSRCHYIMNTTIAELEQADCILLIGTNPRHEAPMINARIRKRYLKGGLSVGVIGENVDLTYDYEYIGDNPTVLKQKHDFYKIFKAAKRPVLILGQSVFNRVDTLSILSSIQELVDQCPLFIQDEWNGFNVLHTASGRVGALDVGFAPGLEGRSTSEIIQGCQEGDIKVLYLLGADEIDMQTLENVFVIYQGHHGDAGANRADVILPGSTYSEKTATYVNTEGRPQQALQAVLPPGNAKEDWCIIRALSEALGYKLPFNTHHELMNWMSHMNPIFKNMGKTTKELWQPLPAVKNIKLLDVPFTPNIPNFYMSDVITRHSVTMSACVQEIMGVTHDK